MICCPSKLPCLKFCIAATLSVGSLIFGATMIAINPAAALVPFYSSLISGSVVYWCKPAKAFSQKIEITNNQKTDNTTELKVDSEVVAPI